MTHDGSTIDGVADQPRGPLGRALIAAVLIFLAAIVAAGAIGLLGPRTSSASAEVGTWRLDVEHASVTRAGQPAPLQLGIRHVGGFDHPIQVSLCGEWFDDLDFQNWYPNPSAETRGDHGLLYEFDPPSGDTLEVHLDARTAPGQFGEVEECRIEILEQDLPVVGVDITNWRMP